MKKITTIKLIWEASDIYDGLCVKEKDCYMVVKSLGYKSDKFALCPLAASFYVNIFSWYSDYAPSGVPANQMAERLNRYESTPVRVVDIKFENVDSL